MGRNRPADFASFLVNKEELCSLESKNTPVPPPRQKKKQCGYSHSIPLYAEVNYSLKKNRRQTAEEPKECSECVIDADDTEVQEQMAVIEGKLVLPGPKNDSSVSKVGKMVTEELAEACESSQKNEICQNIEAVKEPNEMKVVKEVGICGKDVNVVSEYKTLNLLHLGNDCVISQDKVLNTITDNNDCFSDHICSVDNKTSETSGNISPVVEIEVKLPAKESSTSSSLPVDTEVKSLAEKSLITSPLPAPAVEKYSDSCLECFSAEAQENLKPGNIKLQSSKLSVPESAVDSTEHCAVERNSSELYHIIRARNEKFSESEVAVFTNTESVDSVKNNSDISVNNAIDNFEVKCTEQFVVKERDVISLIDADVSQNPGSDDTEYRLSAASLLVKRKLEMKELSKLHRRRPSWSNCKDDSPSPETTLHRLPSAHKHKSKTRSLWCDEGELSSGVLGDLDSSDTTARQSSFEEVDQTGSDAEDGTNLVQSKLSTWLGSLGKGHRKQKIIRDSYSHFYYDSLENFNQTTKEEEPEKEQIPVVQVTESPSVEVQEIEVGGFNFIIPDSSRPPSGLSTLSALDIDQKSDAPVSEESFEIYHHSESENETEINPEDKDENFSQSEETRQDKKAFYIAEELMTSERAFIDVLKLLNIDFRQAVHAVAARQRYPVIPDAELDKILNSLPQLQSLNEDLLRDLENRINNWNCVKKIGDVIVRKGPFLKLYTSYIQNFESQCVYLEECCQKYPRFAKVVKQFEASPRCQKLSLKHYMLKPVQRIPQYRLLLEDYLHHLSPFSPDMDDTRTALKIVCDVADHANRSIKLGDHLSKLLQLQSRLGNYEIIKPGRMFLKDGELSKLSRKGMQPRYFILLNDCLLYTSYYGSVQSSGLKVNYELPLSNMKVSIPQAEDYHNEFSIISVKRSFTLSARSLNERQDWVDALQKAITDYSSRQLSFQNMKITSSAKNEGSSEPFKLGQEAPVWIQDRRVTMCQSCTTAFTVTFRRHHCRACGKVVCGDCSDFRAPLQYMRFQSVRVCEECHNTLLKEAKDPTSKVNQAMKQELGNAVSIMDAFKRLGPATGKKVKKYIPQRLKEVTANDTGSQMSGWLQRRSRRSWKRLWFVLKEQVLYVYKASEDVVALESIPVLGYAVEPMKERHFQLYEGIDAKFVFKLAHPGQRPLIFHADSEHLANRWIAAMSEATVLK